MTCTGVACMCAYCTVLFVVLHCKNFFSSIKLVGTNFAVFSCQIRLMKTWWLWWIEFVKIRQRQGQLWKKWFVSSVAIPHQPWVVFSYIINKIWWVCTVCVVQCCVKQLARVHFLYIMHSNIIMLALKHNNAMACHRQRFSESALTPVFYRKYF